MLHRTKQAVRGRSAAPSHSILCRSASVCGRATKLDRNGGNFKVLERGLEIQRLRRHSNEELKLSACRAEGMLLGRGAGGPTGGAWTGRSLTPVRYLPSIGIEALYRAINGPHLNVLSFDCVGSETPPCVVPV
jgi:hypothetical protein